MSVFRVRYNSVQLDNMLESHILTLESENSLWQVVTGVLGKVAFYNSLASRPRVGLGLAAAK